MSREVAIVNNDILLGFASAAMLCTALNLLIIYRLKMWNGYLLIVTTMAVTQLLYDSAFILRAIPNYETCLLWHYLTNGAGLSTTFWTNVLSFVVGYVMLNVRSLSINKCFPYFVLFASVLPLGVSIINPLTLRHMSEEDDGADGLIVCVYKDVDAAHFSNNFFYWGRLASILFNIILFVFIRVRLNRLGAQPFVHSAMTSAQQLGIARSEPSVSQPSSRSTHTLSTAFSFSQNGSTNTQNNALQLSQDTAASQSDDVLLRRDHDPQHMALATLVQRMQFYPLCQAVCRSFPAYNEFDNYRYSTPTSYALSSAFAPSLGICMFVIFLATQPKAWESFISLFGYEATATPTPQEQHKNLFNSSSRMSFIAEMSESDLEDIIDLNFDPLKGRVGDGDDHLSVTVSNPLYRRRSDLEENQDL